MINANSTCAWLFFYTPTWATYCTYSLHVTINVHSCSLLSKWPLNPSLEPAPLYLTPSRNLSLQRNLQQWDPSQQLIKPPALLMRFIQYVIVMPGWWRWLVTICVCRLPLIILILLRKALDLFLEHWSMSLDGRWFCNLLLNDYLAFWILIQKN